MNDYPFVFMRATFPTMRFIHCVRDGRDTACSAVTRPYGPSDYRKAAEWWASRVKPGMEFGRQYPDQDNEIRFEDLVRRPAESLGRDARLVGARMATRPKCSAIIKTARCVSILRGSANGNEPFRRATARRSRNWPARFWIISVIDVSYRP